MTAVETSIDVLDTSMTLVETSIDILDTSMTLVESSLNTYETSISNIDTSLSDLSNNVTTNILAISNIDTSLADLSNNVTTNINSISIIDVSIGLLETSMNLVDTAGISNLEASMGLVEASLNALDDNRHIIVTGATSDATQTAITLYTQPASTTYTNEINIFARENDSNIMVFNSNFVTIHNTTGNTTIVTAKNITEDYNSTGTLTWSIDFDTNTDDVRALVTGEASTDISWSVNYKLIKHDFI